MFKGEHRFFSLFASLHLKLDVGNLDDRHDRGYDRVRN